MDADGARRGPHRVEGVDRGVARRTSPFDLSGLAADRWIGHRAPAVDAGDGDRGRTARADAVPDADPGPRARASAGPARRPPATATRSATRRRGSPDGRVLVTAGCSTAAALYDPSTGTFSPTGSMSAVRAGETATLLHDGRVLFAGGYNCAPAGADGIWASAELYDPATGTFSPTGSMAAPRQQHTATLLADGRVLIAGGLSGPGPRDGRWGHPRLVSDSPRSTPSWRPPRSTTPPPGRSARPVR